MQPIISTQRTEEKTLSENDLDVVQDEGDSQSLSQIQIATNMLPQPDEEVKELPAEKGQVKTTTQVFQYVAPPIRDASPA